MNKPTEAEKVITIQPVHVKTVEFIKAFTEKKIYSPTIKEIAKGIKFSLKHLYRVVDDLESLGYITRERYTERSIKVIKDF